ncbi:hypothetical protein K8R43_06580 [archaeon]|nr:hypothetical protein [archaeon]
MVDDTLIYWIRQQMRKGTNIPELTRTMLESGMSEADIHLAFRRARSGEVLHIHSSYPPIKKSKLKGQQSKRPVSGPPHVIGEEKKIGKSMLQDQLTVILFVVLFLGIIGLVLLAIGIAAFFLFGDPTGMTSFI